MRHLQILCLTVLLSALTARAQVLPSASGSCSGAGWQKSGPGCRPLVFRRDSRQVVGGEILIVGKNNGEIRNEKKPSQDRINIYDGLVMLMPKGEPYLLRNVGKDDIDLLLIEIRK